MAPQTTIVGIGEVLMDVFTDGTATIGGAPFNVAFQAHQLLAASGEGGAGVIVSAVGEDQWGRHILAAVRQAGISDRHIALNARYPTGIANVFVAEGEAGYEIPAGQAWDHLVADAALDDLAADTAAVAFGSLAQRSLASRSAIQQFVARVQGHRLYDVNLRQNSTDKVKGYDAEILRSSCELATIVKCNSGELEEVCTLLSLPDTSVEANSLHEEALLTRMEQLRSSYKLATVVVTRGARGTLLRSANESIRLDDSTLPLDAIHPVGAGDAFSAGLLYGLTQGLSLQTSARLADRLASWVTGYASATPAFTPEILRQLREIEAQG